MLDLTKNQPKIYPFNEGEEYWTVYKGRLHISVWDDESEVLHDEDPDKEYYTYEEADEMARLNGIPLRPHSYE